MKLNNKRTILVGFAFLSICAFWQMYDNLVPKILTETFGIDEPKKFEINGFSYIGEGEMTPKKQVDELSGIEKKIFSKLYAGKTAKKLYKLYEYRK